MKESELGMNPLSYLSVEIKELYLVVVSFSPWKSMESVGEKYNFAYVELALNMIDYNSD